MDVVKNLFVGSEQAGNTAATLYSLVETCKANDVNPQRYLAYVLEKLPQADSEEALRELLPYAGGMVERFAMVRKV